MAVPLSLDRYGPPLSPTAKYLQERNIIEKESVRGLVMSSVRSKQNSKLRNGWDRTGKKRKENQVQPDEDRVV